MRSATSRLLPLIALAVCACGGSASTPSTGAPAAADGGVVPHDAATPPDASDGSPGSADASSPSADGGLDGCAPSEETTTDGGCVAIAAAGGRTLAMEIDPPSGLDYATEVGVASSIGVTAAAVTLPWSTLETAAPVGGQSQIDTSLFADLESVYGARPAFSLLISIPLVDTASIQAPADLQPGLAAGTLALDDPSVVSRYEKVVDALFAGLPGVKVPYLIVANEENLFLSGKPASMWTALAGFFSSIQAYVAGSHPGVIVGMNVSFAGLLDASEAAQITALFSSSDDVFVSYYLGDNGFGQVSSTTVPADLDTMIAFAGSRPLILKELGYATGTTGHTEAGQVAFITDLFQAWDAHASRIPMVTISRMFDGDPTECASEAQSYGAAGNQDFIAFLCTLGVRTYADAPKPAWATLASAAARRGF
jgi:hypothetical protein